jgi:hypothetical protein
VYISCEKKQIEKPNFYFNFYFKLEKEVQVKELMIRLIDHMLTNQLSDADLDFVMKNTRVHILVTMNPDGLVHTFMSDCPVNIFTTFKLQSKINTFFKTLNLSRTTVATTATTTT